MLPCYKCMLVFCWFDHIDAAFIAQPAVSFMYQYLDACLADSSTHFQSSSPLYDLFI